MGGRELDARRPRDPPHTLLPGENLAFCEPETGEDSVTTPVHAGIPRPRRNRRAPRRFLDYELTSSAAVSFCAQERTLMQRPTPTAGYRCRCCTERFSTLEGQHAHERRVHPGLDDLINATVAVVSERPEKTEEPLPLRQMSTRGCPSCWPTASRMVRAVWPRASAKPHPCSWPAKPRL